ncbi:MAG: GntR family transcriptional regulator [Kiritimatiellaceae bacterium]|nr:GntR family transcriptional regulator [Kiritimatiellaceae bacterium]
MDYRNVREQVTDRLREEILLGKFEAGEALREIPLAERFKVSRGPVRDALLQLSQEGLLEGIPNRGVRVGKAWAANLIPVMARVRFDLESFAIAELIANPTEDFFNKMKKNLRLFKLACEDQDMPAVVQLDLQFHRLMLRECGHPGLESVWLPLLGGLRLPYSRHERLTDSYEEHKQIAEAIEQGDFEASRAALKKNILYPFCKE